MIRPYGHWIGFDCLYYDWHWRTTARSARCRYTVTVIHIHALRVHMYTHHAPSA